MAIYDAGTASLSADGTVAGVGTTWRQPLTLIRVGATMIFNTTPASIVTIAEIISDTEIRVFNDNGFTAPAGTQYSILSHDGITVQGLAQDVAETLRYYQSRETEVAAAVDAFNQFDADDFQQKVTTVNNQSQQVASDALQVSADKSQVSADRDSAAASAASALADKNAAAASAADAADSAASLNTSNLLRVDRNLSDLSDKVISRSNLDVRSRAEISSSYGLSVIDFGAKGDGVTDDTAAFQSAIDSAPIGGLVIVPTPSVFYSIGSEIRISKPIAIQGNGGSAVYRDQYPSIKTSGFNGVFRLVPTESSYRFGYGVTGVAIKGLSIEGRSITDRNPFAIAVDESINGGDYHVRGCDFSALHIKYFDTGLNIKGIVYLNTFFGVRALWCGNGCHIDKVSGAAIGNSDQNRFFGCEFVLNTNGLILSNESHQGSQTIAGCTISESTGIGLIIGYNCTLSITGSQIEANGTGIRVEIPASVTNPSSEAAKDVSGNWFLGNDVDIHVIKSTTSLTSGFSFPMDIRSNSFNRTVNEVLKIDAPTGAKEFDSRQFKLSSSNSFSSDGANPGIIPLSKVTSGWLGYNGFKEDGKVTISAVVNSTSQTNVGLIRVPAFKQCYVNFELVSMPVNADTGGRDRATAAITFANSTNPGSPTAIFEESSTTGGEFMIDRVESETFVSININANAASRNAILSCSYCIM